MAHLPSAAERRRAIRVALRLGVVMLRDLIIDPRRDYQPTGRPPRPTRKNK